MTVNRQIEVEIKEGISLSEHASVVKFQEGKVVGYAESERDGLLIHADQIGSGDVSSSLTGSPPTGETDTLAVCRILVESLNVRGANWGGVVPGSGAVDCTADCMSDPKQKLHIQVIRAVSGEDLWKELAINSSVQRQHTVEQLADELSESIQRKGLKYPTSTKEALVLALDANRLPEMVLADVRSAAPCLTRRARESSGFKEIWVVGPTHELTYKLSD
jgi:hypothetical protein